MARRGKRERRQLIEAERELLARLLEEHAAGQELPQPPQRKRKLKLRKVSQQVSKIWVSAGCFGEAVQWRLKGRNE